MARVPADSSSAPRALPTQEHVARSSATHPSGGAGYQARHLGAATREQFPLTGAMDAVADLPPANPYAEPTRATLAGSATTFIVSNAGDVRVGRDPHACAVVLADVRVSQIHGALRWDNRQLWIRDETSQNGTFVDESRIPSGVWMPVRSGATVRFGGTEFNVRYE